MDETHIFEKSQWNYTDTLNFSFEIKDTTKNYDFFLDVEHSVDYSYQNLYYKVVYMSDNKEAHEHIFSFELASSKGYWLGNCNSKFCTKRILFSSNTKFSEYGIYQIKFIQYTRKEILEGLQSIRLVIS